MLFSCLRPSRAVHAALPLLAVVLFPTLSLLTHSVRAQTTAPKAVPQDEWMGIYLGRQKIGYSGTHYDATAYQGKPGIVATTHGVTKMQLLGREVEQETEIGLGALSMIMVAETKAHALDHAAISPALTTAPTPSGKSYVPPADFAVATAITTAKPIADPRSLRTLKVVIDGIPNEKLILSDARQQERRLMSHPGPPYEVAVDVTAESVNEATVPALPARDPALAPYLKAAPYLPVDDAQIRKTAVEIRGAETNPYRIATNLRDWVHNAMTPDPTIGVPRSAADIFQRRRGVCRDYATLYTALARAAGVPTRLCSGIVYGNFQGKAGFYYHAWAESWVGKWIAVDPTLFDPTHPVNYVDATHIKFAQGDVTQMFQMVSIVGRLKITVE